MKKRIVSIALAALMIVALLPATAIADTGEKAKHQHSWEGEHDTYNNRIIVETSNASRGLIDHAESDTKFNEGDTWHFTAVPKTGYKFSHWTFSNAGYVNIVSSSTAELEISYKYSAAIGVAIWAGGQFTATAHFANADYYTLNTSVTGSGSVSKSPNQSSYLEGTSVTLTATPVPGHRFTGWSGDASGDTNPLSVTMNSNKSITANFVPITYTLTVNTSGSGSVSKNPDESSYSPDASVSLTATPESGWRFSHWSGDASGDTNPLTVEMDGNKTITANFEQITYTLTVNTSGSGSVSKNPNESSYADGSSVILTATPGDGYEFSQWSGDASGSANPLTVSMDANKTITAKFEPITYTITYHNHGTVASNPTTYTIEDSFTLDPPSRDGYEFTGWTGEGIVVPTLDVTIPKGSMGARDYTANWKIGGITVTGFDGEYDATWHKVSVTGTLPGDTVKYSTNGIHYYYTNPSFKNVTSSSGVTVYVKVTRAGMQPYYGSADIRITKATLTVTAHNKSVTYGAAAPSYTYSYSGFKGSDNTSAIFGHPQVTCLYQPGSGAGSYVIDIEKGSLWAYNYDFDCVDGELTVGKAELTVKADNKTITYGDDAPVYTVSYSGFKGSDNASVLRGAPALDSDYDKYDGAGSYPITVQLDTLEADNYTFKLVNGTLTVKKAKLTVKADNKSITYGDAKPAYTVSYSGFKGTDNTSVLSGHPVIFCVYARYSPAGYYPISVTKGTLTSANYDFKFDSGWLTVNRATLTVTADNKSITYGDAKPAYTVTYSGFKGFDSKYVLVGAPKITCSYQQNVSGVGSYTIDVEKGTLWAWNYTFNCVDGTLTVGQKAATITANDKSKTYGEADPALDATVTGAVNGETLDYSLSRAPGENAGDYDIIVTLGTGAVNDNYNITTNDGTLTIAKKAATITANDKSKTYGEADPALDATVTGEVNGETLDYSLSRAPGENAGDYDIIVTLGTGAVNDNYNITTNDGMLTISKKALTVTAEDKTVTFLDAIPEYTAVMNGFITGEDKDDLSGTLAFECTYAPGSAVGTYSITPSGLTSGNYEITFVDGTLTVETLFLNVTFVDFNGTVLGTDRVAYGTAATAPADPRRAGHRFTGWSTDFRDVRTNLTVRAQYAINRYTVTFIDYDGTVIETQRVDWRDGADAPADPQREGYTFIGWDTDYDPVTSNLTVTALYRINTYTVRFVDFDGSVIDTQTVNWNTGATAPANPSREGFTFIGWDTDYDPVTSDLTVTAQYEAVQVIDNEGIPGADDTTAPLDDEIIPKTGGDAGLAWWVWALIAAAVAALLFFLIFFVWRRRREEDEQQA